MKPRIHDFQLLEYLISEVPAKNKSRIVQALQNEKGPSNQRLLLEDNQNEAEQSDIHTITRISKTKAIEAHQGTVEKSKSKTLSNKRKRTFVERDRDGQSSQSGIFRRSDSLKIGVEDNQTGINISSTPSPECINISLTPSPEGLNISPTSSPEGKIWCITIDKVKEFFRDSRAPVNHAVVLEEKLVELEKWSIFKIIPRILALLEVHIQSNNSRPHPDKPVAKDIQNLVHRILKSESDGRSLNFIALTHLAEFAEDVEARTSSKANGPFDTARGEVYREYVAAKYSNKEAADLALDEITWKEKNRKLEKLLDKPAGFFGSKGLAFSCHNTQQTGFFRGDSGITELTDPQSGCQSRRIFVCLT